MWTPPTTTTTGHTAKAAFSLRGALGATLPRAPRGAQREVPTETLSQVTEPHVWSQKEVRVGRKGHSGERSCPPTCSSVTMGTVLPAPVPLGAALCSRLR